MTLTMLWKNHRKTLINLPWKYHESNSTHFCFPIFGWLISSKSENFDAVAIHQFWSKWPQTKPKWLILVCFTTNFAPKRYFFELRCPNVYMNLEWHWLILPYRYREAWSVDPCENIKKFGTYIVGRDGELVKDGAVRFSLEWSMV